jgi:DNA topoisomerase-6 subunit B
VPFTSESKEAIAEYDEIRKEITLALRECGRRLGAFLRRRERAQGENRRRNIFELYIEEVVASCNRLKGGRLPTAKLKEQLQRMALKRTGGEKTDELLGRNGSGPEGLPHSIIVTPEGIEGEAPVLTSEAPVASSNGHGAPEAGGAPKVDGAREAKAKTKKAARRMPRAGRTKGRTPTRPTAKRPTRARRRKA